MLCSLKVCCVTLFHFPHLTCWSEKSKLNLDSQNKQGAQKGKHLRNQRRQFCPHQRISPNEGLLIIIYECKWCIIDMFHCGCKHNISTLFSSSENVSSHETFCCHKNYIKWIEANQKVVKKKPGYFSLMERIDNLHTDKNNTGLNS